MFHVFVMYELSHGVVNSDVYTTTHVKMMTTYALMILTSQGASGLPAFNSTGSGNISLLSYIMLFSSLISSYSISPYAHLP